MTAKSKRHKAISPIVSPYGSVTMAHVGYLESRHLQPERLPSARREKIVSLRLLDVSVNSILNVQRLSTTIRRLSASRLHLKSVPDDLIGSLTSLTKLDLSNNWLDDKSFPDCMTHLLQLVDVSLACNKLTKVPTYITKLKHLKRLDLSDNQIASCNGLDKLKRLQILVVDNNKLVSVVKEITSLRRLEVLRCRGNLLEEIPGEIRQYRSLIDLDISDNRIAILPADIFLLPKLDALCACRNEINKVQSFNIRPQNKHWMSYIDLSDNKLTKFPGHLLVMTLKLDLSNNKIKALPYHIIKKLDFQTDQQLIIRDNPLCYPPPDICNSGLRSVISFFQESATGVKVYQGIKVLVLGHHRSGKTSLVQTLVDQQPRVADDINDASGGIDIYDMTFGLEEGLQEGTMGKSLELSILDFNGHPFYMYPHYSFFEHPSVAILTFNMAEYSDDRFYDLIGCWLDWMLAKTNKIVAVFVGTQSDKLTDTQIVKVSRDVKSRLNYHLDSQTKFVQKQIKLIEERPHISPTLSEQLKSCLRLLQSKSTVITDVICTSAKRFLGFDKVRQSIENYAANRQLFPNVMRVIPTFWLDVRNYFEDRGNAMTFPVLKWEEFEEELTSRFGMKHLIKSISQYLHEIGQIIWFSNSETLKRLVILRPSWLFDVLRLMFRHDLETSTYTPEDNVRSVGLTTIKFERLKYEALSDGVIDRDLIRCFLAPLIPNDYATFTNELIKLLADGFQLVYPTTNHQKDTTLKKESQKSQPNIIMPWLLKNSEPHEFTNTWNNLQFNYKLVCCLTFPLYLPPGLFEVLCVRAHSEKYKLQFMYQWGGGFYGVRTDEKVHLLVTITKMCDNAGRMIRFEIGDELDRRESDTPTSTLWKILQPLLLDFEQLISNFSGILVERLTECPMCQSMSFLGEWLTPKETQSLETKTCEVCKSEVRTCFLVPPKEQKRVIIRRNNSSKSTTTRAPSLSPKLPALEKEIYNIKTDV